MSRQRAESWSQYLPAPIQDFQPGKANFICQSDGGTRSNSCSATGWIVEAVHHSEIVFPVAVGGTHISSPLSSFAAEALALDEAISVLHKILPATNENQNE